jgi:lipopolysaccharide export system permease protein
MRLLDRYLLRELLVPLGYCLGGFLVFWLSFNLFTHLEEFQEHQLRATEIAYYYLVAVPEQLVVVLPVALLLAMLYSLTNHARYHELTAMRAAGVSLWRVAVPYLGVGLLLTVSLFLVNELWVPGSSERADRILLQHVVVSTNSIGTDWKRNLFFQNERDHRSWNIPAYNVRSETMTNFGNNNIILIWHLPDGTRRDIYAEGASFTDGHWTFYNAKEDVYESTNALTPRRSQTNILVVAELWETPELINSELRVSALSSVKAAKRAQLSIREIMNYLRLHPHLPAPNRALLQTQLHARLAAPWTCLIVVLIALPFGAPSGRRNVFVGVASSIFICFAFFILQRVGLSLGIGGMAPAWLAAWLPILVFGGAAIWLTSRVR